MADVFNYNNTAVVKCTNCGADIETEQLIIRNIIAKGSSFNRSCGAKKTCIVATHRPSILALCDKIFRVQDAKITLVSAEEAENYFKGAQ